YTGPNGDKQYVSPNPQTGAQFNQWQQQTPWDQGPPAPSRQYGAGQAPTSQNAYQQQYHGSGPIRDNRANRLGTRSQYQADRAADARDRANENMQSGNPIAAGVRARQAGRRERRSNRSDRRADRWGY